MMSIVINDTYLSLADQQSNQNMSSFRYANARIVTCVIQRTDRAIFFCYFQPYQSVHSDQ